MKCKFIVSKGKSISSVYLEHIFVDQNTAIRGESQVLFPLNPKTLMFFFFNIYIYSKKFFSELIKYPLTPKLFFSLTLKLKNCVSVIRVCLKLKFTKFYSKSPGELVDMPCIIFPLI